MVGPINILSTCNDDLSRPAWVQAGEAAIDGLPSKVARASGLSVGMRVDDTKQTSMLTQLINQIAWAAPFLA